MAAQNQAELEERRWLKKHHLVHLRYTNGGVHLIVKKRTGVIYRNQVGGIHCGQMDAEGYVIPVGESLMSISVDWKIFSPARNFPETFECNQAFRSEARKVLERQGSVKIRNVRFASKGALEAWVPLTCEIDGKPCACILTWMNSD